MIYDSELEVISPEEGSPDVDEYDHLDHQRGINDLSDNYLSFYT